jgi:AraC family transcriptional regulator of adaptative response/methylated-DNA-[protein]-cysteine methyltransferase
MMTSLGTDFRQLNADYALVEKALRFLADESYRQPDLREVAEAVGLSEYHFQRTFTRWAGISPKRFLQFLTRERARALLDESNSLLSTTFEVGLSSLGRLHDLFITTEAVTPGEYKTRGAGLTIRYGLFPSPFGQCLLGATDRGICHLGFVQFTEGEAIDEMVGFWKEAKFLEDQTALIPYMDPIFEVGRRPGVTLPILLRGTNFQIQVWEALLRIPAGAVTTYEQVAARIGRPKAVRAVGNAVASNPVPVIIPCHRVIRKLGEFGRYRYGSPRKAAMLGWEFARTETQPWLVQEVR